MENLEDKKEQPRERLSADEALDEANMVRALLTDWKGWLHDGHRTKAQYEAAHEAVLEMRKAAEQETDEKKFLYQAARILHNVARVPLGIIAGLDEALAVDMRILTSGDAPNSRHSGRLFNEGIIAPVLGGLDHFISEKLADPHKEFKKMEKGGTRYAKRVREEGGNS